MRTDSSTAPAISALADTQECVFYTDDNLEELLAYYLEHEDERQAIAAAGRRRLGEFSFERLWGQTVEEIETDLECLRERAGSRPALDTLDELQLRSLQALNTKEVMDATLVHDLRRELESRPRCAVLQHALGLVLAWAAGQGDGKYAAAAALQEAWMSDPRHVLAGLNLAEVLLVLGQKKEAVEQGHPSLHIPGKTPAGSDATDVIEPNCAAKVFCHGARTFGKTLRITWTGGFAAVHSWH